MHLHPLAWLESLPDAVLAAGVVVVLALLTVLGYLTPQQPLR